MNPDDMNFDDLSIEELLAKLNGITIKAAQKLIYQLESPEEIAARETNELLARIMKKA